MIRDRLEEIAYRDGLRATLEALLTKYDDYCDRIQLVRNEIDFKLDEKNEYSQAILDCIAVVETLIKDAEVQ